MPMPPTADHREQARLCQLREMGAGGLRPDLRRKGQLARGQGTAIEKRRHHRGSRRVSDQRRDLGDDRACNHFRYLTPKSVDEHFDGDRSGLPGSTAPRPEPGRSLGKRKGLAAPGRACCDEQRLSPHHDPMATPGAAALALRFGRHMGGDPGRQRDVTKNLTFQVLGGEAARPNVADLYRRGANASSTRSSGRSDPSELSGRMQT